MTPLKVRGRRGQKARLRAQRKEQERLAAIQGGDTISPISTPERTYVPSRLESLPTEIIESIFLYSRNINLPRASLALGHTLSSTSFKHVVLRNWLTDPYLDRKLSGKISKLQSALLRCRWFDEPMLMHALQQVCISSLAAFFQNPSSYSMGRVTNAPPHNALLGLGCPIADTSTMTITAFVENLQVWSASSRRSQSWEWISHSNEKFQLAIPDYAGMIQLGTFDVPDDQSPPSFNPLCDFKLAYGCEIPAKVLHRPWTKSKRDFLDALMSVGTELNWITSSNGEVAEKSLREAILQEDNSTVEVLLRRSGTCRWLVGGLGTKGQVPFVAPPGIRVELVHIRLAIFEGGCNPGIVRMLALAIPSKELPVDDDDIMEWATARKERGDKRAMWLLEEIGTWRTRLQESRYFQGQCRCTRF
ncbi:MAG: hypothetical protein Q9223_002495 [Gallowayella weberi]